MSDTTNTGAPAGGQAPVAPAAPAAPSVGQPTHVTQTQQTGYQPQQQPAAPAAPALGADGKPVTAAPAVDTNAKPDDAAMRAFLTSKDNTLNLDGKTEADVQQLYADAKAKETLTSAEFKLPDEYKDKSWAAKVKSQDDLYKQLDNLTALVGKKAIVPDLAKASPEEREAFYSQMRGKDVAEYAVPDNPAFPTLEAAKTFVPELFMKNGVSPVQAQEIIKGYQEFGAKQMAEQYNPDGFKASMQAAFGNDWEKTTGQVRNTIKGMMNADDQKQLDAIPNNLLGVVYRTLGNVVKHYGIKETDAAHFGGAGKVAATDVASVRQGLRDQLAALSMRPHTADEQSAIIEKLNATYTNDPRIQAG